MDHRIDILGPRCILFSWLSALLCFPLALVIAVLGQGVGAILGGCSWIGVSIPLNHQVWALVNQPAIGFADTTAAHGYWLGSIIVPFIVIIVLMFVIRSTPSLAYEIFSVHLSWALAVLCFAWLIINPAESHLGKWLHFHDASAYFIWTAPLLGMILGMLPALRLLAVLRLWRRDASSLVRVTTVIVHLGLPTGLWVVLNVYLNHTITIEAAAVLTVFFLAALILVWFRYPAQPYRAPREIRFSSIIIVICGAALLTPVLWFAGRPLEEQGSSGLLWSAPSATNNIRPWITPQYLFSEREDKTE